MQKGICTQQHLLLPVFLLICGFWLAGCGYSPGERAQAAILPLTKHTIQTCGTIALNPMGKLIDEQAAVRSSACFEHAYRQCQQATLIFTAGGIDTVTMHTFTIVRQKSACVVTDLLQHRVIPMPFRTTGRYTCTAVSRPQNALLIENCGAEGTVTIPLNNRL